MSYLTKLKQTYNRSLVSDTCLQYLVSVKGLKHGDSFRKFKAFSKV